MFENYQNDHFSSQHTTGSTYTAMPGSQNTPAERKIGPQSLKSKVKESGSPEPLPRVLPPHSNIKRTQQKPGAARLHSGMVVHTYYFTVQQLKKGKLALKKSLCAISGWLIQDFHNQSGKNWEVKVCTTKMRFLKNLHSAKKMQFLKALDYAKTYATCLFSSPTVQGKILSDLKVLKENMTENRQSWK